MKRNRDAIAQMAIYDLLCRMNDKSMPGFLCVLQMLDEKNRVRVRCDDFAKSTMKETCRACIAAWLNERSE